jgi:hypothetical protein
VTVAKPEKTARQKDTELWALGKAVRAAEDMTGADHGDYRADILRRRHEAQAEMAKEEEQ